MVKQLKIAISGQSNTGKDTLFNILDDCFWKYQIVKQHPIKMSFATPIKQMAQQFFPDLPNDWLYGSSKYRNQIIPNAFKNNQPLTVRQLLIDIGTQGRLYNINIWVNNLALHLQNIKEESVIVSDVRYRNEYEYLKQQGFFQIRLYRSLERTIDHDSETKQSDIRDDEFDYVLFNNSSLKDLKKEVITNILPLLK